MFIQLQEKVLIDLTITQAHNLIKEHLNYINYQKINKEKIISQLSKPESDQIRWRHNVKRPNNDKTATKTFYNLVIKEKPGYTTNFVKRVYHFNCYPDINNYGKWTLKFLLRFNFGKLINIG